MIEWLCSRAHYTWVRTIALVLVALTTGVALAGAIGPETSYPNMNSVATPCAPATPSGAEGVGSPVAGSPTVAAAGSATPAIGASCAERSGPVGFETPMAVADLSITISPDKTAAGPVTITIDIVDAEGAPVDGAVVILRAKSLDMDMGTATSDPLTSENGRYVAEKFPMGMGGAWQIEVEVARPGEQSVVATFKVTLTGPG